MDKSDWKVCIDCVADAQPQHREKWLELKETNTINTEPGFNDRIVCPVKHVFGLKNGQLGVHHFKDEPPHYCPFKKQHGESVRKMRNQLHSSLD